MFQDKTFHMNVRLRKYEYCYSNLGAFSGLLCGTFYWAKKMQSQERQISVQLITFLWFDLSDPPPLGMSGEPLWNAF